MDLPIRNIKIAELINKHLLGELTKEEQTRFNSWLLEADNKVLFEEIKKEILSGRYKSKYDSINLSKGWVKNEKLLARDFRKITRYKFLRVAAAVLFIIAVSSTLFVYIWNNSLQQVPIAAKQQVKPGEQKAELVLADGSVVKLTNEEKKVEDQGMEISTFEGVVKYDSSTKSTLASAMNTLIVPVGGEYQLNLPDGTKVWLNSLSQLKYPIYFTGNERKVYLQGEAYFEVKHDPEHPFIVATEKGMEVTVLGTSFNMMTYDDEPSMQTTLVKGSVQVNLTNGETVKIEPGEQAQFNKSSMNVKVTDVDANIYTAWVNGRFVFEQENLESILRKLGRWYDVNIFYQNESVKNKRLSADLRRYEEITSFLDLFSQVSTVEFEINGRTILVKERSN